MGLDMTAFITREHPSHPIDFEVEDAIVLHVWRKHANLHGWMEDLYAAKGGDPSRFIARPLLLTADDLDALEEDVRAASLPDTVGLFFGTSGPDRTPDDLAFIARARAAIGDGFTVFYEAIW